METRRADSEISQDFYGERYFVGPKTTYEAGYSDYDDGECMQHQAALCTRYLAGRRVVDIGCATGADKGLGSCLPAIGTGLLPAWSRLRSGK